MTAAATFGAMLGHNDQRNTLKKMLSGDDLITALDYRLSSVVTRCVSFQINRICGAKLFLHASDMLIGIKSDIATFAFGERA